MNTHRPTNLRSGKPNTSMHVHGQGGSARTMALGMATVVAGLGAFWAFQFRQQNRSHNSSDPSEVPTWQHRHAEQSSVINDRMGSPGGVATTVRSFEQQGAQYHPTTPADRKDLSFAATSDSEASRDSSQGQSSSDGGIVKSIMSALHGDANSSEAESRRVEQPAPIRRLNDRGGMYTKNTDYKDGYRRE